MFVVVCCCFVASTNFLVYSLNFCSLSPKLQNIDEDEKMLYRFAKEKQKHHQKQGLFNLNDDDNDDEEEALTHLGKPLSEADDYRPDDEDDDDEDGDGGSDGRKRDAADFVSKYHFGGGFVKKDGEEGEDEGKRK